MTLTIDQASLFATDVDWTAFESDLEGNPFVEYSERTFEYESRRRDETTERISQTVLGYLGRESPMWDDKPLTHIWSDVLAQLIAHNGERLLGGRSVLELGAGCGLIGLVAARFARDVTITDGDADEVALIMANCVRYSAPPARAAAAVLRWGLDEAQQAEARAEQHKSVPPLRRHSFDVVIGSQIVYLPNAIVPLAQTIAYFLAPYGEAYIYNRHSLSTTTPAACRTAFEIELKRQGLVVEEVKSEFCCATEAEEALIELPLAVQAHLAADADAYIIRIRHHTKGH